MNFLFILLSFFLGSHHSFSEGHKIAKTVISRIADNHLPCIWNQTLLWTHPYQSTTVECCDEELKMLIQSSIREAADNAKLGNLAKFVQRKAQLQFHMSFETIISKRKFAISSHYHGSQTCRIYEKDKYYLVYATPVQYDPFNMKTEEYLASIDSADPLGSTKPANFRGDFPDIREDATAGDDLSIQPSINSILQHPNKFAWPDPDEEVTKRILQAEEEAMRSMNQLMESVTEISIMNSRDLLNSTNYVNVTEVEIPNPMPIPRIFANLREKDSLPKNTHCDNERKDGNKCCNGKLASTMRNALRRMATSLDFDQGKEGIIAAELQEKVQQRFKRSYEVIVSRSDFVVFTYNAGDNFCKFEIKDFYILAYATPKQYDIDDAEEENALAATSSRDPLGSNKTHFENEAPWHIPLQLETFGERAGYPVGSHCTAARTGSKCCSLILFNAMKSGYDSHIASPKFDPYDIRNISKAVQWNVEEILQHSSEVIVSLDDFVYASYNNNNYTCKYRVDQYHILAYTTPNHNLDDYDEMATFKIDNEPEAEVVLPTIHQTVSRIQLPYQNTPSPHTTTPVSIPTQIYQPFQYIQQPVLNQEYPLNMQPAFNRQPMYLQGHYIQSQILYPYTAQQPQLNPFLVNVFSRSKRQIGQSPYPIHQSNYNDIGSAKPFNCPAAASGVSGLVCCDGVLQFEASKVIDEAKQGPNFDKHNTRILAKLMTRAVQKRFGTTFESIVAESDFSWGTNKFNGRTCKIDSDGYSALTYQSSSKPPPASDFIDIPNDPTLGGPTGSNSGAGNGAIASSRAGGGGNGGGGNGASGNSGGAGNGNGAAGGADGIGAGVANGNAAGGADGIGAAVANGNAAGGNGIVNGNFGAEAGDFNAAAAQLAANADSARRIAFLAAAGANNDNGIFAAAAAAAKMSACFSADTWVTTPSGKKRMDQISIGDYVLTANLEKTYFTPITLWIHRNPEKAQEFLTIITEYGKALRMTSRHFMYRNKCGKSYPRHIEILPHDGEAIFASDIHVGDCVIVLHNGRYQHQKVKNITRTVKTGIYSPLTINGRIIVNDMLASCYSEVRQSILQTTFFWAYEQLRSKVVKWFGDFYHNKIDLPIGTTLSKDIMDLVLPLSV